MDRETKVILIIYSALLLLISSPLLFFGHVKQNPDDFYEYNYTKIKYYTKYNGNDIAVYKLQTVDGKRLTMKDINVERQTNLPDKKHKLGTITVVLKEYTTPKKNIPYIVKTVHIKPTLVITKYKYDE
ncbi:hypothetical protein [Ligilactobacillus salivarius]|uniref:Uncharacterized protein n=1 Tax=Ligilactobacillus salivarius TaxID=1624 RepID=A0A1V9R8F7_9LACO|nr:hypothetical protein [Ligilactobacillus salivarius]OQQ89328.1 hypothetical protein B6U56_09200 [Ligilactobacillus salivarius]